MAAGSPLGKPQPRSYEWNMWSAAARPLRLFAAAAALSGIALHVAEAKPIKVFGDWSTFVEKENGHKVCYMGSEPKKTKGQYAKRGDTYILVTHRPAEKAIGVVSVRAGYVYKTQSEVEIKVDSVSFRLFTDGGHAWARDAKIDHKLVAAMKAVLTLIVNGFSSRGTLTTDAYSLKGFTAAYRAISKACGVE